MATQSTTSAAIKHKPIPGSKRVPLRGAKAIGPANPHRPIEVMLKLRRQKALPELAGRPKETMTREQLAAYGASKADIDKVTAAFAAFGLKAKSNAATRTVILSGTIAQMEAAFQVKLMNYEQAQENFRGRVGTVNVPADVADIVRGVFGLDNRRVARRGKPVHRQTASRARATVDPSWYKPAELAARYDFPSGDGSGQTVALLEFGGGYFPSDLKQFCQLAGIETPPTVTAISVDGMPTNAHDGAEGEVMLDIEVVAGVCPKAKIVLYFAQFTESGWLAALDAVFHDSTNNPSVLSISWGEPEDVDKFTTSVMEEINESLKEAALLGITVCVAAGDDGSSDADTDDGLAHVDFPAASPYVLAVGGTTITTKGGPLPDVGWFEPPGIRPQGGSTGGGCSTVTQRPAWQSNINVTSVNPGAIVGRCIPDLAANADWDASPYLLVVDGSAQPNGGTSAASPLMAAMIARMNAIRGTGKWVGYLSPVLYQAASGGPAGATVGALGCTDVVTGDNDTAHVGGYSATPGYDAISGWGTPNGQKLLPLIPSP